MHPLSHIRSEIRRLLEEKESVLVAIDGNCTAGKTTLADKLLTEFDCNVFHMDEFFLQPHQRTTERLSEAGGNVDYERFFAEVLTPLIRDESVSYRPYDCQVQALQAPVSMPKKKLNIIEGTYSCHPSFGKPYDLTVFLTVSPEVQRQRVLKRPEFLHQRFLEVWIPMEEQYFDTFSIAQGCDLICSGQEDA